MWTDAWLHQHKNLKPSRQFQEMKLIYDTDKLTKSWRKPMIIILLDKLSDKMTFKCTDQPSSKKLLVVDEN